MVKPKEIINEYCDRELLVSHFQIEQLEHIGYRDLLRKDIGFICRYLLEKLAWKILNSRITTYSVYDDPKVKQTAQDFKVNVKDVLILSEAHIEEVIRREGSPPTHLLVGSDVYSKLTARVIEETKGCEINCDLYFHTAHNLTLVLVPHMEGLVAVRLNDKNVPNGGQNDNE